SGLIFGQNGQAYGSFVSQIFADFYNEIPIAGFYPHTYFNQYAYYTIALSSNPDSKTFIETFSNTGHDFVYIKANFFNNYMNVDEIYPGIFADWDIGNYSTNRGGYCPSINLFYMYDNGGSIDTNYYGIMGISVNGSPLAPNSIMGMITDSLAWSRWDVYHYMTTTVLDTIVTDADYRIYACLGPYSFPAGDTLSVVIAFVAGTSLEDLLANAQAAIEYGLNTPVEQTSITELDFALHQNYPNPFNPSTTFRYSIPTQSKVVIKVFDILGNEIATLIDEEKSVGTYELTWNAANLPSGVYFYQLRAGEFISTKKMILLK
ncbi:MAG: T9SS type A sorting domain-containing protein, partial [Chlorobium sp.]|nr:T9SS type A sorting domain-containing protein [Chlorobium sp.]